MKYFKNFVKGLFILVTVFVFGVACCLPGEGSYVPPGGDALYDAPVPGAGKAPSGGVRRRSIPDYIGRMAPGYMFSVMDADKDGYFDAKEWMESLNTKGIRQYVEFLDLVDEDGDEVLSYDEFMELVGKWRKGEIPKKGKQKGDE